LANSDRRFFRNFQWLPLGVYSFGSTSLFQDLSVFSVIGLGVGSTSLFQDLSVFSVLVLPVFFKTYQCFRLSV
jgi:hypothetical protein